MATIAANAMAAKPNFESMGPLSSARDKHHGNEIVYAAADPYLLDGRPAQKFPGPE
jgi:hypothetical protein